MILWSFTQILLAASNFKVQADQGLDIGGWWKFRCTKQEFR